MTIAHMFGRSTLFVALSLATVGAVHAQTVASPAPGSDPSASAPMMTGNGASIPGAQDTPSSPDASAASDQSTGAAAAETRTGAADASAAQSATTVAVTVGAQVKDTKGAPVGTIEKVEGGMATLATATAHRVRMPLSSFASQNGALIIAMTAAEVDAAAGS